MARGIMTISKSGRRVLLNFAWNRPGEINAKIFDINNRLLEIFELRRLFFRAP
jgi:hypothetical protein